MISKRARIHNQLLAAVHVDPKDNTAFRIELPKALNVLTNFDYLLPDKAYANKLEELLNKRVVGKAIIDSATKHAIVAAMIDLADEMTIDEARLNKFIESKIKEEEEADFSERINDWRKQFYGNMSKEERSALISKLEGKVSDELLNKILQA